MKRQIQSIGITFVMLVGVLVIGCKKTPPPLSERISKPWTAESVREGSATVFTRGAANNTVPGYSSFRLDLNRTGGVTLTEFDNNTFTGQWELIGDTRIVLRNLNPQPTGTGGTIEYTITSVEDFKLALTRTTASAKTGGTINQYVLTNP